MQNDSDPVGENARLRGDLLTMATRISHDLRTPLSSTVAAAQMLQEILAENNLSATPTQAVLESVDDLTQLIKRISFVLRATAEPKQKTPVPMKEIVTAALQRLESRILGKNATIVEPAFWPQVSGVASYLEEVWWNLLANAVQHGKEGVRIQLNWQEKEGGRLFEICDDGGGVPEEIRKGLFCPFHLLHRPEGVKGLGLSVIQRLIALQGGECGYEPRPDGSRFFFFLSA